MVRKKIIDEPQNLNHNVVPERAEIGQLTPVIAHPPLIVPGRRSVGDNLVAKQNPPSRH